jgi:hypothetical protein
MKYGLIYVAVITFFVAMIALRKFMLKVASGPRTNVCLLDFQLLFLGHG